MAKKYDQLSSEERAQISQLFAAETKIRQIAKALRRSPSTISREVRRNQLKAGYNPIHAQDITRVRRIRGSRLSRKADLREAVLSGLKQGLSPEQVSAQLKKHPEGPQVGRESIYRFIFGEIKRTNDTTWSRYLPSGKYKRGRRRKRQSSPALCIKERVTVHSRPAEVNQREELGHWEGDLMSFSSYNQHLLVLHERKSRMTLLIKHPIKTANATFCAIQAVMERIPAELRKTMTFDNGTEFAEHYRLHAMNLQTYFCDPHSPWQKGGIENSIKRLRKFFPRRTNLDAISETDLRAAVMLYNQTPRKCLRFRSPAEVFFESLHLERVCALLPALARHPVPSFEVLKLKQFHHRRSPP